MKYFKRECAMRNAFTMIELIFVIVVAGILAAVALPRLGENNLNEAVDQVVNHIRYTQHLAMQDNKFGVLKSDGTFDDRWYRARWQILFHSNAGSDSRIAYSIFSDRRGTSGNYTGNPDIKELAVNPANPSHLLSGGFNNILNKGDSRITKRLNIGKKYGVEDVTFAGGCNGGKRISFDNMGRPLTGNLSSYTNPYGTAATNRLIQTQCIISICTEKPCPANDGKTRRTIVMEPETGYVHVRPLP